MKQEKEPISIEKKSESCTFRGEGMCMLTTNGGLVEEPKSRFVPVDSREVPHFWISSIRPL